MKPRRLSPAAFIHFLFLEDAGGQYVCHMGAAWSKSLEKIHQVGLYWCYGRRDGSPAGARRRRWAMSFGG